MCETRFETVAKSRFYSCRLTRNELGAVILEQVDQCRDQSQRQADMIGIEFQTHDGNNFNTFSFESFERVNAPRWPQRPGRMSEMALG